jgi:hypothetical protein
MRYGLRTLLIVAGLAPPMIAFLWLHWGLVLFLGAGGVLLATWLLVTLGLARFFAGLLASVMD